MVQQASKGEPAREGLLLEDVLQDFFCIINSSESLEYNMKNFPKKKKKVATA